MLNEGSKYILFRNFSKYIRCMSWAQGKLAAGGVRKSNLCSRN